MPVAIHIYTALMSASLEKLATMNPHPQHFIIAFLQNQVNKKRKYEESETGDEGRSGKKQKCDGSNETGIGGSMKKRKYDELKDATRTGDEEESKKKRKYGEQKDANKAKERKKNGKKRSGKSAWHR